jgi:hypothetical protein
VVHVGHDRDVPDVGAERHTDMVGVLIRRTSGLNVDTSRQAVRTT